jgi:hypothetical protein
MKQFISSISLVVVLIVLTTTSCKKDTDEPFIGKWEIQLVHIVGYVDDSFLGDSTMYFNAEDDWIQFNDDNTGYQNLTLQEYSGKLLWSVDGDIITLLWPDIGQPNLYLHFAVSGTTMAWYAIMNEGPYTQNPSKTYKEIWYTWLKRI